MKNKNLISMVFTKRLFSRSRRVLPISIVFMLVVAAFAGCGKVDSANEETVPVKAQQVATADGDTISVVTTIFPEYDWVKEVSNGVDNVDITMLLDNGVDLHSYQPTAEDIMKIATCDVFIYVGGESDEWVEDALEEATNPNMQVINLLEALGDNIKEEELVEGMQGEEEEEGESEEEEGPEYDEHVWLSVKNAKVLVEAIADSLSVVDAENADIYKSNADDYSKKLSDLDEKYQKVVDDAEGNTVLFGDRFPFRYLVDDYGIDYYAAFVGCSAETEASFETITFLSKKVDEIGLNAVLTIENSDQKIAETIIANTNSKDAKILTMDSMQSTTSQDVAAGTTYLDIMEKNVDVLAQAL